MYSSDVGKMIGCPVLHVNGDNPEVLYTSLYCRFFFIQMRAKYFALEADVTQSISAPLSNSLHLSEYALMVSVIYGVR